MQSSLKHKRNATRRGRKRILTDLTNMRISDKSKALKKLRIVVDEESGKDNKDTSIAALGSDGITSSIEDMQRPHYYPSDMRKIDKDGHLFSRDYVKDIAKYLAENEEKCVDLFPDPNYFPRQSDIRPRMRTILFTWMTEVHVKYKMKKEVVLWAAFQICDRYLSKADSNRRELQLVGCTALWIASKYHDIYPPLANDFVNISDNAFSKSDLFAMEGRVCQVLEYEFTIPNAFQYLERYTDIALESISVVKVKNRVKWLARYGMERFNLHVQALEYCPSLLAAGALFTALKLTSNAWTRECESCSGYGTQSFLRQTGKKLNLFEKYAKCILDFNSDLHRAVVDKYKVSERGGVSTLRKKKPEKPHVASCS